VTHDVLNQPPPLEPYDLFTSDRALVDALRREGGSWGEERARRLGAVAGNEGFVWGRQANVHPPVLRTHDRYGHRIDEVEFHPAWHDLMRLTLGAECHALPWRDPRRGAHVVRAALLYVVAQAEAGHVCPVSMTFSAIPLLRGEPGLAEDWLPRLTSTEYDPRSMPATAKRGALCGMAMTEKQGGTDLRANTTRARPLGRGGPGGEYELTGHKWFCSAPMCDVFVVVAQTERGLSCFLLPRWHPDGTRNRIAIQRLKDKLGNRSNASGEIELEAAWARLIGEEGRGVATIMEMIAHARLECAIAAAAVMRQAVAQATHHATHRTVFGKSLAEQPLMRNVLADLCVESEAAVAAVMRLARAYDERSRDEQQRAFARLVTPVIKFWVCKRTPALVAEALECLGGNGYVEESILPRLYREAPVNSIWEGSANVMCLDVLRVLGREPAAVEAFLAELAAVRGTDRRLDAFVRDLADEITRPAVTEGKARRTVERLAIAVQGALLLHHGDPAVAEAFAASRFDRNPGFSFGTLPDGVNGAQIVERALPSIG
jgi:putative acyl-CoA dehydrogenase